jgi:hypothetical protein
MLPAGPQDLVGSIEDGAISDLLCGLFTPPLSRDWRDHGQTIS